MTYDTEDAHRRMYRESWATHLKSGQTTSSYISLHEALHRRIIQSNYPKITEERSSVLLAVFFTLTLTVRRTVHCASQASPNL